MEFPSIPKWDIVGIIVGNKDGVTERGGVNQLPKKNPQSLRCLKIYLLQWGIILDLQLSNKIMCDCIHTNNGYDSLYNPYQLPILKSSKLAIPIQWCNKNWKKYETFLKYIFEIYIILSYFCIILLCTKPVYLCFNR